MKRPRWQRPDGDRGAVTVEVAGYTLLMLLAMMIGVQAVTWGLAALGARFTANHAAQRTRVYGGTIAAGEADANTILASAVGNALNDPRVDIGRSATTVTVTVRGTATSIIPGFRPPVTATVHVPVERIN
ncbi:TadE family protein [Micromonospora aurantiaca]|uniref:TadE family protein n=2 Tax=Micromonospora aurantiaca (nom. illeg.) TaxID=47850 RepID=A0A6N3K795_9ACTN|nr:TadE family protein [Micromonospora aurantiaca]